ncbi:otitis media-associated H10 [Erysipelotrichaceae bacterium I46]|uniref:FtsK/SpoIIIE domain-containing protein n=1 Tax=Clostridium innocuum TaxID=1522 RepID=UPI0009C1E520|nr:FtsK/SpoIIIE domain-containing protein [[Clostridium] innocuum]ANU71375.2 otitis media-associated H10 [Erysipelotrichaceae bacterium I46]ASU20126.1 otitis media-associated H10 [[Clostridium] innocuum]QQR24743.1 DNA translocase FtsK [[Clostridium] innocuum]
MDINKLNNADFHIVSLMNKRKIDYKLVLLIGFSIGSMFIICGLFDYFTGINFFSIIIGAIISFILFILWIIIVAKLWINYIKMCLKKRLPKNGKKLRYLIQANNLFESGYIEKVDSKGKICRDKVIINSVYLGYYENDEYIVIRAFKRADIFNDKMNELDSKLCALYGVDIDNKIDRIKYCDYIMKKVKDERIIVEGTKEKNINETVYLPLNNNTKWNVLKQPHLLLAGVTGSGKTTFLNYLIIEMRKMNSTIYICDPKRSDLSSIKHYWGDEFVASETNMIARMTRKVKEEMMDRFIKYKENPTNFVYGYSYVDYGLKPIFLIFDELGAFRASADKKIFTEAMDNLTEIILKGREMGVFCVLSTQQPNANNIPTELRDNLSVRLAMGNMSSEAYKMVFGDIDDLETINTVGAGYIYLDGQGWNKPKFFEAPYLDYKTFSFIDEIKKYNT